MSEQSEQVRWQRRRLRGQRWRSRGRPLLWQDSQAAMMGSGDQQEVVAAHPFEAGIAGMRLQGKLSLSQPATQGFGINGEQTATISHRQKGHGATPFVLLLTRTTADAAYSRESSWEISREKRPENASSRRAGDQPPRAKASAALWRRRQ